MIEVEKRIMCFSRKMSTEKGSVASNPGAKLKEGLLDTRTGRVGPGALPGGPEKREGTTEHASVHPLQAKEQLT